MSDPTNEVPAEPEESYLDGSEPISDDEDLTKDSSQALMPSDLDEPALLNGRSGGEDGEAADAG